jgi:hypothetical protein
MYLCVCYGGDLLGQRSGVQRSCYSSLFRTAFRVSVDFEKSKYAITRFQLFSHEFPRLNNAKNYTLSPDRYFLCVSRYRSCLSHSVARTSHEGRVMHTTSVDLDVWMDRIDPQPLLMTEAYDEQR